MPRVKSWSGRIPLILQHLEADTQAGYTRAELSGLFIIGRSQAANLMKIVGAEIRNGTEGTVSRTDLRRYVEHCPEARAFLDEVERKRKLARRLVQTTEEMRQKAVPIPGTTPADEWTRWQDLANVSIEPGLMRIIFSDPDDLAHTLWMVAKAMANEPDKIEVARQITSGTGV